MERDLTDAPRLLVVGLGSAGSRHARIGDALGYDVAALSRRGGIGVFRDLDEALDGHRPTHIVIANETSGHWPTLAQIRARGVKVPVLVEKPVSHDLPPSAERSDLAQYATFVAYNLRFHPKVIAAKNGLSGRQPINAAFMAGQDLNQWRPGRALADCYSARSADGGGVLRDLSHELDLATYLLGTANRVAACGGTVGPLGIAADDAWSIILQTEACQAVTISLDYYHRPGVRRMTINCDEQTFDEDLRLLEDKDLTYRAQLKAFVEELDAERLCTFDEGLAVVALIHAIERAALEQTWVAA